MSAIEFLSYNLFFAEMLSKPALSRESRVAVPRDTEEATEHRSEGQDSARRLPAEIVSCPPNSRLYSGAAARQLQRGTDSQRNMITDLRIQSCPTHPQGRLDRREAGLPRSMCHGVPLPLAVAPDLMHCSRLLFSLSAVHGSAM